MTPEKAYTIAKTMTPVDVAALVMTAAHVLGRLRELAEQTGEDETRSRCEGLAAQLAAGLTARPATVWLTHWSNRLELSTPANGKAVTR